jgi:PilZ domain
MATLTAPVEHAERRTAARRQPAVGTVCRLDPGPGLGLVWNISSSGVSFLVHEAPARGASVRGVLATADEGFALPVSLRVAHVARLRTGDYVVGGQFDHPLAPDQMRPFLAGA